MQEDPHALPSLTQIELDEEGRSIWNLLLAAEQTATGNLSSGDQADHDPWSNDHLIAIRVLGHFLKDFWDHQHHHLFFLTAYHRLRKEIANCSNVPNAATGNTEEALAQHEKLFKLGLLYRDKLIFIFHSNMGSTPGSTSSNSSSIFDLTNKNIINAMGNAPKTKMDVKLQALIRDGYRCMITNAYDSFLWHIPDLLEKVKAVGPHIASPTDCTHIFSESVQDEDQPTEYSVTAFTMVTMFGLEEVVRKIVGNQVNSLHNVLTLSGGLHTSFDRLDFWLEEVPGQPYTYDICSPFPQFFHLVDFVSNPQRRITFTVYPNVVNAVELPDRRLLAIRAVCLRVAHASGIAKQIYQFFCNQEAEDSEDTGVLENNGSTANILCSVSQTTNS